MSTQRGRLPPKCPHEVCLANAVLGSSLPFAAPESNAPISGRTDQPHAAKPKTIGRSVPPKVCGRELRIGQNSEVTEVQREEHGALLGWGVQSRFAGNRVPHPRGGRFEICFDLSTSRCDVFPERSPGAAADNLDRDFLVAIFHGAIFAGVILGARLDDGRRARRGEDIKNAGENVGLSAPAGIDGRLHGRANAPIGAD
jgi:hypothetical protein